MTPTEILICYLFGGHLMLLLVLLFEPNSYTGWEVLGWCAAWPVVLMFYTLLCVLHVVGILLKLRSQE